MRYAWNLKNIPSECVCKENFDVYHALSCKICGLVTLLHNEMGDLTVDLLSTVCKDVCKEPCLQQSENGVELRADASGAVMQTSGLLEEGPFYLSSPGNRDDM